MEERKNERPRGEKSERPERSKFSRRNNGRRSHRGARKANPKIEGLVRRIKKELNDSIEPIIIPELNAFERKLIHRQFDNDPNVVTKTYRLAEEEFELRVYPVGNLKRFAKTKAEEAVEKRETIVLPPMSNYERFVIHDYLKTFDTVKTNSIGEEEDRHIEIEPEMFGRGLRKIMKKIKLF